MYDDCECMMIVNVFGFGVLGTTSEDGDRHIENYIFDPFVHCSRQHIQAGSVMHVDVWGTCAPRGCSSYGSVRMKTMIGTRPPEFPNKPISLLLR